MTKTEELTRLYDMGWQWFKLHAQQRMQIVSFWFVAMSFLCTAAAVVYSAKQYGATLLISSAIVLSSILFLLFDFRTRELISYGEQLMAAAEKQLSQLVKVSELVIVSDMHSFKRRTVSYRTLFTLLYGSASALGLFSIVLSLKSM